MQLAYLKWNSLISRLLFSIFVIVFILGLSLAWLINQLHAQKIYNHQTEQLMADIPQAIKNIKHQHFGKNKVPNILPQSNPIDFIMVSCDKDYHQVWTSKLAAHRRLENICQLYQQIAIEQPPYYLQLSDNKDYLIYSIPLEANREKFELLVLKDAKGFSKDYEVFSKHTYIKLIVILTLTFMLMLLSAFWGLKPFREMRKELEQIRKGKKSQLDKGYPEEFAPLSASINQLIQQTQSQNDRYKHTSDDLAHSIKTRLASIKALTETYDLPVETIRSEINNQISQLNQAVNYHLKRASLGRSSLFVEETELFPIITEITSVLHKVYFEKNIDVSMDIDTLLFFPVDKDDLTELCGNLLENAYKLCFSKIQISAYRKNAFFYLTIEDDGCGIDDRLKKSIFARGYRADTTHDGNGIGLAVCHEIVTSYNGHIEFQDSQLGGAKVVIQFPVGA